MYEGQPGSYVMHTRESRTVFELPRCIWLAVLFMAVVDSRLAYKQLECTEYQE